MKQFLISLPLTLTVAFLMFGCEKPVETCAGIYDNGQPCDQEYDPNYDPTKPPKSSSVDIIFSPANFEYIQTEIVGS